MTFDTNQPQLLQNSLAGGMNNVIQPMHTPVPGANLPGQSQPPTLGGSNGFDLSGAMGNFALGAQGITGLAGAYNAYKQMGLMEDQLNFSKSLANRNISNQAATTNRMLEDRASMAAQMTSGAEYGSPEFLKTKERLRTSVDGSPVG